MITIDFKPPRNGPNDLDNEWCLLESSSEIIEEISEELLSICFDEYSEFYLLDNSQIKFTIGEAYFIGYIIPLRRGKDKCFKLVFDCFYKNRIFDNLIYYTEFLKTYVSSLEDVMDEAYYFTKFAYEKGYYIDDLALIDATIEKELILSGLGETKKTVKKLNKI